MILSHRHRFIFLKTRKVGGSSLELALSPLCGPDDVVTAIGNGGEERRQALGIPTAQNWIKPVGQWTLGERLRRIRYGTRPARFYPHMTASEVRSLVADDVWNSYFKFSVIRDPWDYIVSKFFWNTNRPGTGRLEERDVHGEFRGFLLNHPERILCNSRIFSIDGEVAVDVLVRYEALEEDLAEVSRRIGLDYNLYDTMRRFGEKTQFRPRSYTTASMFEGFPEGVELVRILAADQIRLGGYEPPNVN